MLQSQNARPEIDPEFYRYQTALVKDQLSDLQSEMNQLHNEYPDLRDFSHELLWEQLTAIEADTYAEFVRTGRLNSKLAPLLAENLTQVEEKPL